MGRIYLVSATEGQTNVSCLDMSQPAEKRVISLLHEVGEPLYSEKTLCEDDWRERILARLPDGYQMEPERWFVACSGSFFTGSQKQRCEEILGEQVKLVAASDAVRAYYEARQKAVTSVPVADGVVVLSVSAEGFSAERLWVEQDWKDAFCPTLTSHFELLKETTGSRIVDELLVELNIAPNCEWSWNELPPEQEALLKRFREDEELKRRWTDEMHALRLRYLRNCRSDRNAEQEERCHIPAQEDIPELHFKVNRGLLKQAVDVPRRPWLVLYECFAEQIHKRWGPVRTVLCSGEDWFMEELIDITDRELQHPHICAEGAGEAVARGMELLAEKLLKAHTIKETWRCLRQKEFGWNLLRTVYREELRAPLQERLEVSHYIEPILERWKRKECTGREILYFAYHDFLSELSYTADRIYQSLEEGYLRFQGMVRQELSRSLAEVFELWTIAEEDDLLHEESGFYSADAYINQHISPEFRECVLDLLERHYGFTRYLRTESPDEERNHPDLQEDRLERTRGCCRREAAQLLDEWFMAEKDCKAYIDDVYAEVQHQLVSEIGEIMGFYPLEEYCCEKEFEALWPEVTRQR